MVRERDRTNENMSVKETKWMSDEPLGYLCCRRSNSVQYGRLANRKSSKDFWESIPVESEVSNPSSKYANETLAHTLIPYTRAQHSTHSSTCMHCACILNTIQNTDNTWPQSQNKKNLENCVTAGIIGNGNRQAWMSCICESMWVLSVCIHGYRSIYTYRINAESPNEASNGFCGLWSNVNNMALATTIIDQQKKVNNTNDDDNNNSNLLLLLYVRIMRYFFLYQENAMPNTNKIFRSISNVHFTQQVRHKRSVQEIPI